MVSWLVAEGGTDRPTEEDDHWRGGGVAPKETVRFESALKVRSVCFISVFCCALYPVGAHKYCWVEMTLGLYVISELVIFCCLPFGKIGVSPVALPT